MDVHNAFLHGDLDEEVYMKLPQGFACSDKSKKYADYSLFSYSKGAVCLHILIYVDDFIITCNDQSTMHSFKVYLNQCFHMKDLGRLKYFLGIEVARNTSGFFVCQRKYALDIIAETGLLAVKPASTPIELNQKLATATGPLANVKQYRRLVGRLIYLVNTRPELSYTVHILTQFMQNPLQPHLDAALRVVCYLKGCPGQGVFLNSTDDIAITALCDFDWAACPLTRLSLSAYFVFLGRSPVSWKTKKQQTVSHSSAEAEYRSMAFTLKELNKSAIHIAANPVFHERTKHIENDCHAVREAVEDKLIATVHVSTKSQLVNILTKALPAPQFEELLSKLGIRNPSSPT
ncbi:unnamed protein product [Microthlaspi erraticum]|uniref:Reverse transcriptase Ty1/copia-type domain-containing protein n=1 Tax=Microthlaspi erraticum TaxID=1685480 RepID=A0A6D2K046_9BRAS|nr:unnamed protein product [Microthlaspi erraticum]